MITKDRWWTERWQPNKDNGSRTLKHGSNDERNDRYAGTQYNYDENARYYYQDNENGYGDGSGYDAR